MPHRPADDVLLRDAAKASVAHLVNDYMKNPVRLAFGSTLKPSENVRLQAFEVTPDRKQDVLQHLLTSESRPVPRLRAHQARSRAPGQAWTAKVSPRP